MAKRDVRRRTATRRSGPKGLATAVAGVLVLLACAAGYRALLGPGPSPSVGGPFDLVDSRGRARSEESFRGRYMLIFFGYTHCADVCPQTLTQMSAALGRLDPQARLVQPLFITIDPERDTLTRLRQYVSAFSPTLIGLTGTPAQLGKVEQLFHVVAAPDRAGDEGYDHSAVLYLLGPDGRFIAPLPADAGETALLAALHRYVRTADVERS